MTKTNKKTGDLQDHRPFRWLEGILLVIVLCVTVLRLSFIEQPQNNMQNALLWTTPRGMSLLLSAVLFVAIMSGLVVQIMQGRWNSNKLMAAGWLLFVLGILISTYTAASDKRAAMAEGFTLAVPMLAALILCRWLDSPRRVSVVLWVILSIGCAAVYVSADQALDSNENMVEDYRQNPGRQLQMLGIEPNSLAQFQYEHRLHSKDIRGFLTTSNSTGTFLLAGIFIAAGLAADAVRHRKNEPGFAARLLVLVLVLLILLAGLFIGKSRGALAGGILAMVLFILLLRFGRQFWNRRRVILTFLLLAFAGVWAAAIIYGVKHGRLPGPNAMYVRWQYWVGAVQMAAGHPLGVGGGNFGTFYTQYKIPAASETVRDPHNIVLSILCQFGPLGLLGLSVMILAAFWRGLKDTFENSTPVNPPGKPDKIIALGVMVCTTAALLWVRPFVSEGGILGESAIVRQSVYIVMYLIPAFCFICPFGLLWATGQQLPSGASREGLAIGIMCAVAAILVHNLIDFALFEPGIWTMFWILIALILSTHASAQPSVSCPKFAWVVLPAACVAVLYFYVWIPVRAGVQFQEGLRDYNDPTKYFQQAARIDPLDPDPWVYTAKWYESRFASSQTREQNYLTEILTLRQQARQRDPYNFIHSESLSDIYVYLSESQKENTASHLESAYQAAMEAQRLYPGSDRIAYSLGILAEKMNQPQKAAEHFRRAVEIEDQYRKQFSEMYPKYPLCSRLGQERYEYAKNFILKPNQASQ
jgi:O-antigen ligase